jgi:glycosyltransferase involved in cell wall biosynthesis
MNQDVSVIIPVHNRFELLHNVVESILAQTVAVSEIIVIDDGSTEHEPEMVERYIQDRSAWRGRVRYHYQENQGQSVANNVGIAKAKTEWLAFDGADDLWLPWKLEWQFRALHKYRDQCGLCFTDAWFMNNPHMKTTVFQFAQAQYADFIGLIRQPAGLIASRHPIWMQTVVARADLIREIGGFDAEMRYSEDHDLIFRAALKTDFCFVNLPLVLIDRSPSDNRHIGESRNWHKEEFRLRMDQRRFEKQQQLSDGLPAEVHRSIRRNLREIHSAWANYHLAVGDYEHMRVAISAAAQRGVTPAIAIKWLLMHVSPTAARAVLSARNLKDAPRYDQLSWTASESGDIQ